MNILLLHLPLARRTYASHNVLPEPLTPLFLAPAVSDRHAVRLVDLRITPDLSRELGSFRPDLAVVGVAPAVSATLDAGLRDLKTRFPDVRILLAPDSEYGREHFLDDPAAYAHPLADALLPVRFFTALRPAFRQAAEAISSGGNLRGIPGIRIPDGAGGWLQGPPDPVRPGPCGVPDRTLLGRARGRYRFGGIGRMAHLIYVYGCRFKCRFCPMSRHDGSLSVRPLDEVMEELRAMTEPNVFLEDYEPFLAPEAMAALADAIEKAGIRKNFYMMTRADTALREKDLIRRWRRIGLRWLYLGLDGHSPERLREIRKGNSLDTNVRALREMESLGLGVSAGFLADPSWTREDFRRLRESVRAIRPPMLDFTVETPMPGSALFDEQAGRLTTRDWSLLDLEHAVTPTAMPLPEFYREMTRLHVLAGRMSTLAMLRRYPLRDALRLLLGAPAALLRSLRAARDHGRGPLPRACFPLASASSSP